MVKVRLDGIGGHDRAGRIVDALAQHLGIVGKDLQELGGGSLSRTSNVRPLLAISTRICAAASARIVSKSRASMICRRQAREVNSGEGSIGHARHLAATTRPKLWGASGWQAGHMPGWHGAGMGRPVRSGITAAVARRVMSDTEQITQSGSP
jgi:hypothetical protein